MTNRGQSSVAACVIVAALNAVDSKSTGQQEAKMSSSISVMPATMARVGVVDDRYQSYNVEMLEVTGGKFWRPYGPELDAALRNNRPPATTGTAAIRLPA